MIKVDRLPAPLSLNLGDPGSAAFTERQVILDHIAANNGQLPAKKSFKVYSSTPVKSLLIQMFEGKCAYCEIFAVAGADGDVEHYRPKGGVTDADRAQVWHPGYWWLAMVWSNLVLSCQHCNQSRRQLIHTPGQDEATIERELVRNRLRTTGKKNRFPVQDNVWVTDYAADIHGEVPLLVDPTEDDPELLFEWEFERSISTVKAAGGNVRAAETIEILGLNRRRLTEARVAVLDQFRTKRRTVLARLNEIADPNTTDARADALRSVVLQDLDDFNSSCAANSQFAGMARAFRTKLAAEVEQML